MYSFIICANYTCSAKWTKIWLKYKWSWLFYTVKTRGRNVFYGSGGVIEKAIETLFSGIPMIENIILIDAQLNLTIALELGFRVSEISQKTSCVALSKGLCLFKIRYNPNFF